MSDATSPATVLREAVERLGGQNATARLLGIAQPSVWRWLRHAKPLPPEHVLAVEAETGISRHDLRPDIYPPDAAPAHAAPADRGLGSMEPAR